MERSEISRIAHRNHPIAAPVSHEAARTLLSTLHLGDGRIVDLGCGNGEWLLGLLELNPAVSGVGVDLHLPAEAGEAAERRGLASRVRWVHGDAATWDDGLFDTVMCIGASHVFGGLSGTLDAVRRQLVAGGQVLLGDAIWETPPSAAAKAALDADEDDFPTLSGLLANARDHGFEPSFGHISTLAEWDDYEWSWTGSLTRWALREAPTEQDRRQALDVARDHRDGWIGGYRGELGFVTVVLDDVS